MSDFIYTQFYKEDTISILQNFYSNSNQVHRFSGSWGDIVVKENNYAGYSPYETEKHIMIVLGGPLLKFSNNDFIGRNDVSNQGTKAIYYKWLNDGMKLDSDLDGPFVIVIIDKEKSECSFFTDMMSFIPLYAHTKNSEIALSTHVDLLAKTVELENDRDLVSEVDFILNGIITFPYTAFKSIKQLTPASIHTINKSGLISKAYWLPYERKLYRDISEAAFQLKSYLRNYVECITRNTNNIAQFISGGEDSRVISGLLSAQRNRDTFVFLDSMNNEGILAKKTANIYGAQFHAGIRAKTHYLDILPRATKLVGAGTQYYHAHTIKFDKEFELNKYRAVFGGLMSDALLKGSHIPKIKGSKRLPFLPDLRSTQKNFPKKQSHRLIKPTLLDDLYKRQMQHFNYVSEFRRESATEWFELWPSSMNRNIGNVHVNRRLFRSYEPFLSTDIIKLSASVPQKWKLNRKLFREATKEYLKPSKWLLHSDGRYPYFDWKINFFIQSINWLNQQTKIKLNIIEKNQGAWNLWEELFETDEWKVNLEALLNDTYLKEVVIGDLDEFYGKSLHEIQKVNLVQLLQHSKENFD